MTRELTHDVKQRWGMLGYGLATFRALRQTRPFHAEIRSGGKIHKVLTLQIYLGRDISTRVKDPPFKLAHYLPAAKICEQDM